MSRIPLGSPGHVYILSNASMPGILKIGATTDFPDERAKQLTTSTSAASPFFVAYSREVSDCTAIEAQMHSAFAPQRVNESREFFRISLYEAARTLDMLAGDIFSKLKPATPFAELFSSFADDGSARELTESERRQCQELQRRLARA